jgi:hypothetical protein
MKAVCHRNRKQELWGQHNIEVPLTKVITDVIGTPPWRKNGSAPVGYSDRAALREQCDMRPEKWNSRDTRDDHS